MMMTMMMTNLPECGRPKTSLKLKEKFNPGQRHRLLRPAHHYHHHHHCLLQSSSSSPSMCIKDTKKNHHQLMTEKKMALPAGTPLQENTEMWVFFWHFYSYQIYLFCHFSSFQILTISPAVSPWPLYPPRPPSQWTQRWPVGGEIGSHITRKFTFDIVLWRQLLKVCFLNLKWWYLFSSFQRVHCQPISQPGDF